MLPSPCLLYTSPLTPCLAALQRRRPLGADGGFQGREGDQRDGSGGKGEGRAEGCGSGCWETSWAQLRARRSIPAVLSGGSLTSCSCSATLLQLKHPREPALREESHPDTTHSFCPRCISARRSPEAAAPSPCISEHPPSISPRCTGRGCVTLCHSAPSQLLPLCDGDQPPSPNSPFPLSF